MNLLYACEKGDMPSVKYFLQLSNVDERDFYGNTGLTLAVRNGHKAVAEFLIDSGANINTTNHVSLK